MSGDLRKRPRLRLDLEHYRALKTKILERDGWKCQRCGRRDQLQIHHIIRRSQLGGRRRKSHRALRRVSSLAPLRQACGVNSVAMPKWMPCKEKFIIGDVVWWKEAVWVEKGKRKKKLIKVGERRVTAEVLTTDAKGLVCLSVCKCEILANLAARVLEPFKKGVHPARAPHDRAGKWRRARMERRRRAGERNKQVPGLKKARLCRIAPGGNCLFGGLSPRQQNRLTCTV
jgi:hypothetical protein